VSQKGDVIILQVLQNWQLSYKPWSWKCISAFTGNKQDKLLNTQDKDIQSKGGTEFFRFANSSGFKCSNLKSILLHWQYVKTIRFDAIKSSWAVSHIKMISIWRDCYYHCHQSQWQVPDIHVLEIYSILTWLTVHKYLITFTCRESLKCYVMWCSYCYQFK
jgi:hypothetical protein